MEKFENKVEFLTPEQCDLGDNFKDYYVELKNVKKGDIFYECENGYNYKLVATEDARGEGDGWSCTVETKRGEVGELFVSGDTEFFGPNFFWAPKFITIDEEKKSGIYLID